MLCGSSKSPVESQGQEGVPGGQWWGWSHGVGPCTGGREVRNQRAGVQGWKPTGRGVQENEDEGQERPGQWRLKDHGSCDPELQGEKGEEEEEGG